jgi:hypothetical protein
MKYLLIVGFLIISGTVLAQTKPAGCESTPNCNAGDTMHDNCGCWKDRKVSNGSVPRIEAKEISTQEPQPKAVEPTSGLKTELGTISNKAVSAGTGTMPVPAPTEHRACYVNNAFQGFPCADGGRLYTAKGQSTLI